MHLFPVSTQAHVEDHTCSIKRFLRVIFHCHIAKQLIKHSLYYPFVKVLYEMSPFPVDGLYWPEEALC